MPKPQRVREDELTPKIAEGLTQGLPKEEALRAHPVQPGAPDLSHMSDESTVERVPVAKFVAEPNGDVMQEPATGRIMQDVARSYSEQAVLAMSAGMICMRCDEPQESAFPLACSLCGYEMRALQALDFSQEFQGNKHIGPLKPRAQTFAEMQERAERRQFIRHVLDGGQGKVPKEWFADKALLEGLSRRERRAIGAIGLAQ